MAGSLQRWWMIAPLLVFGSLAHANDPLLVALGADPFNFDPAEQDPIRFTRAKEDLSSNVSLGSDAPVDRPADFSSVTRQTAFSFKLKPKLPDFSREGGYGLDLFDAPRLDVKSYLVGFDGLNRASPSLHDGLEYSAGVRLEHEDAQIDGTAYVSSSLLGLSYGRLGRLWYGAIDVNLEQFSSDNLGSSSSDVLSLDVTTGRRFGITGLDAHSPLWMLSVQGNLAVNEWEDNDDLEASSDWYINPSLFWQQPGFMFSAQMQVPMEFETLDDEGEPDYRLRAVFEKQFK
ncbi:MAG: hypothetical protein AB8B64_09545 [Granulosicoccus sp.]